MIIDYEGISKLLDVRTVGRQEEFLAKFIGKMHAATLRASSAEQCDKQIVQVGCYPCKASQMEDCRLASHSSKVAKTFWLEVIINAVEPGISAPSSQQNRKAPRPETFAAGSSYRKTFWVDGQPLRDSVKGQQKIRAMLNKKPDEEPEMVHGILPEWLEVERVVDRCPRSKQYFVKWCGLPYTEATWEDPEDLQEDQVRVLLTNDHADLSVLRIACALQRNSVDSFIARQQYTASCWNCLRSSSGCRPDVPGMRNCHPLQKHVA